MLRTEAAAAGPVYVQRLLPIITPVFRLLESGSQEAYKFIDGTDAREINKHLFSMIVRDHVCRGLDEMKLHGTLPFRRVYKANSGIEVYYDDLRLKVLRPGIDEDGDASLPPPKNPQQELFYLGNHLPWGNTHVYIGNLVMLWESDHVVRSTSAWLACPDEGKRALFFEPIPHPATTIRAQPPVPVVDDDDDLYQRVETEEPLVETGKEEGEDE